MATTTDQATEVRKLSEREIQVIKLTAAGFTSAEVAEQLNVTPRTVKAIEERCRLKLGVMKRRELPLEYMRQTGDDPYPRP